MEEDQLTKRKRLHQKKKVVISICCCIAQYLFGCFIMSWKNSNIFAKYIQATKVTARNQSLSVNVIVTLSVYVQLQF